MRAETELAVHSEAVRVSAAEYVRPTTNKKRSFLCGLPGARTERNRCRADNSDEMGIHVNDNSDEKDVRRGNVATRSAIEQVYIEAKKKCDRHNELADDINDEELAAVHKKDVFNEKFDWTAAHGVIEAEHCRQERGDIKMTNYPRGGPCCSRLRWHPRREILRRRRSKRQRL